MERKTMLFGLLLCLWLAACGANSATPTATPTSVGLARKPSLRVSAPADGAQVPTGGELSVQSSASDERGIVRVELWTDGFLYRVDVTKETEGLPSVSVTQTWIATTVGSHTLQVKAVNRDGGTTESGVMTIGVVAAAATPNAPPPTPPPPTATPASPSADCTSDAAFVSDVSVPDGAPFKPGDAINKVWRVRNTGTCAWTAGYQLTFVDGAQLDASTPVAVPPTAPGATADIAVKLTAPRAVGTYTGKWKLSALNGSPFGQTLTVIIRVVDASQPTPTRAPSVTPTPGALAISFTVSRSPIPYGDCATLRWDVDNAQAVKLDNKGVVGHDTRVVCPTETKTYTLQAFVSDGSEPVEREVVLEVKAPTKAATGNIDAGKGLDLDTGVADTTITANADFQWDAARTLQPKNGATFVLIGSRAFTDLPQDECANASGYGSAPIGSLAVGNMVCFKTNAGRSGKLRVEGTDGVLTVKWVTW